MSLDNGKSNIFRIHADKPEGEVLGPGLIKDSSGKIHIRPDDGWPAAGLSYLSVHPTVTGQFVEGWPDGIAVSTKLIDAYAARGLVTVEGAREVVRPSRPDPGVDENGSARITEAHMVTNRQQEADRSAPPPHVLPQADRITFKAYSPGGTYDEVYDVVRNPDKYVAGDTTGEQQVTPEIYADGETEVEWFYTLRRVSTGQEK